MKVSVVITVFKRPERLLKAITTVKNQTLKDIEIIVVDGSNSSELKSICEKEHVKYLQVEPEYVNASFWKGIQHQRNIGCKNAIGEYIAMLDDDDDWDKRKLEEQLHIIDKSPEIGLVVCYNKTISGKNIIIDKPSVYPEYDDLLKTFTFSSTSTYFIRKSVLEKIGWWNEELRGIHEYDIALKILKEGYKIFTVPQVLMTRYRSFNQERKYYYIKIAEIMDFWKYYSRDFVKKIGVNGLISNYYKTCGLFGFYMLGFVIKEKVWNIIYPLKWWYEKGKIC